MDNECLQQAFINSCSSVNDSRPAKVVAFNEKLILQQVANGDRDAFNKLVTLKWNNIYSQALTYVKSTHQAQDIVQDVFLKIWENRQKLTEVERFDSYLFIVARNYIISGLRKKIDLPFDDSFVENFDDEYRQPDKVVAHKQLVGLISKAVQLLPPQQNLAYRLSRDEGMSYEEIAGSMGLSKETVKKHICRALNFLRVYVKTHSELSLSFILFIYNYLQN